MIFSGLIVFLPKYDVIKKKRKKRETLNRFTGDIYRLLQIKEHNTGSK